MFCITQQIQYGILFTHLCQSLSHHQNRIRNEQLDSMATGNG